MRRPLLLHPSRHGTLIKPSGEKNDRKSRPGLWLSALRSQLTRIPSRGQLWLVTGSQPRAVSRRVLTLLTVTFPATLSSSLTLAQTTSQVTFRGWIKQSKPWHLNKGEIILLPKKINYLRFGCLNLLKRCSLVKNIKE